VYNCSEVVKLISTDEYLAAGPFKKLGIRLHLLMCKHCARYARQLRILAAALRESSAAVPAEQLEQAKARILKNLPLTS
jgi:hypothetical protein